MKDVFLAREGTVLAILAWLTTFLIGVMLYFLVVRPIWYKTVYSSEITDTCTVTRRDYYITSSTIYVMSGKVMIPVTTTHSHFDVKLECQNITLEKDSKYIYKEVQLNDKVNLYYKKSYITPRFYDGEEEFDGYSIEGVSVIK